MTNGAWQAPPDRCADNYGAAKQEQSDPISTQGWVDVLDSGSNASYAAAQRVGKFTQHRSDTEEQLIEKGTAWPTTPWPAATGPAPVAAGWCRSRRRGSLASGRPRFRALG
jgi:hypothetical protein